LHSKPKSIDVSTSPTLVNHETPQISDEEPTTYFFLCPPSFPVPMRVPPNDGNKVGKFAHQIPNPKSME